ncbi:MAG: efflux RND transporter periplasmic adaptor subunit [Nevskiales bacterium]
MTVLAGLGLGATAYVLGRNGDGGLQEQYRFEPVTRGPLVQAVSANGSLNPVKLVSVGTQVSGTVRKLYVDFNDKVQKDQILLELDDSILSASVRQSHANVSNAQASLSLAQANVERIRGLYAKEYVSRQELDQAEQVLHSSQAQVDVARAQLDRDQANLANTVIRSPVDGVVVNRAIDVGQTVAASFQTPTLIQIAQDLTKMQINSSFAEADIGLIREGQQVRFKVDAYPEREFEGAVRQIRLNATTVQNVVTYDVVVAVDNTELILLPGMTAYVNVVVTRIADALLVPNNALRFRPKDMPAAKAEGDGVLVYVLRGEQLVPVEVKTGAYDGQHTQVLGGDLRESEQAAIGERNPDPAATGLGGGRRFRGF